MDLNEAFAIYLYLRNSDRLDWNKEIFDEAWKTICREAEKAMKQEHKD